MTSATTRRVRVLRGVDARDADIGTVRAQGARHLVVDPELVQGATDDGYRAGYQAGFDAALLDAADAIDARERARAQDLAGVIDRLTDATMMIAADHADILATIEAQTIQLAIAIAETLVGRELELATNPGAVALIRALRLAPPGPVATAYLHPDDCATLGAITDIETMAQRSLTIVPSPDLDRGDCVVDVDATRIDARIRPALERIRELVLQ